MKSKHALNERIVSRHLPGMSSRPHKTLLLIAGLVMAPVAAQAQQSQGPWTATLRLPAYETADFDKVDGELDIQRLGVGLSRSLPGGSGFWSLNLSVEQSKYERTLNTGPATTSVSELGDATEIGVGVTYFQPGPALSWFVAATLNDGTGDEADFGDGLYLEGAGGFMYALDKDLKLGLAVTGRTELEEDTSFGLFPIVEWQIDERNKIGFVRSTDPTLGYTYTASEKIELYAAFHNAQRQFRLLDDAAFVDEESGLRFGVNYIDKRGFTAEAYFGTAQRTLSFDVDGSEALSTEMDAAAFFGVAATYRF